MNMMERRPQPKIEPAFSKSEEAFFDSTPNYDISKGEKSILDDKLEAPAKESIMSRLLKKFRQAMTPESAPTRNIELSDRKRGEFSASENAYFNQEDHKTELVAQQAKEEVALVQAKEILASATADEEDTSDAPTDKANLVDLFPATEVPKVSTSAPAEEKFDDFTEEFFAKGDKGESSLGKEDKMAG